MASQAWSLEDCTSLTTQREESSLQQQTPEREHGPVRMPGAPGTAGVSTGRGVPGEPGGGANRGQSRGTGQEAHLQMVKLLRNKTSTQL